jgi:predicted dehydrogenase
LNLQVLTQSRVLRAAVIGGGVFGRFHAAKYHGLDGVELVGVADPSIDMRRQAASKFGVRTVSDWHDLIGKVDIVSVCSPAVTHGAIVRAFLASGAHVLVEKPIATDLDEAENLIALARSKGLVLTVGHQERFVFQHSGLLDHEAVPISVECVRAGPWTGRGTDVSVVLDLMIHDLDLVHQLIPGALDHVSAWGRPLHSPLKDEVWATLEFENGCRAGLFASRIAKERRRSLKAVYADGIIEIDFLTREVKNTTHRPLNAPEMEDPLGASIASFVESVRTGAMALVRPEEARRALETALRIEQSAAPMIPAVAAQVALFA